MRGTNVGGGDATRRQFGACSARCATRGWALTPQLRSSKGLRAHRRKVSGQSTSSSKKMKTSMEGSAARTPWTSWCRLLITGDHTTLHRVGHSGPMAFKQAEIASFTFFVANSCSSCLPATTKMISSGAFCSQVCRQYPRESSVPTVGTIKAEGKRRRRVSASPGSNRVGW